MAAILSHPFRLDAAGGVATVDQDTDTADAEQLAVLILTRPRERPLVPTFGLSDPTFAALNIGAVNAALSTFGPPVAVTAGDVAHPDDGTLTATLTFEAT